MKMQIAAYAPSGERLALLPEARQISVPVSYDEPALTFQYPDAGPHADLLRGDVCLGVEFPALAGGSWGIMQYSSWGETMGRFISDETSRKRNDPTGMRSFTARAYQSEFAKMLVIPTNGHVTDYPANANPAGVIATRVQEAKNDGHDVGITVIDGGGWAADNVCAGIILDPYSDLQSFVNSLTSNGYAEIFWVGRTCHVMPPGAMVADRTGLARFTEPNIVDQPETVVRRDRAGRVLVAGDDSNAVIVTGNPTMFGYPLAAIQASGITDSAKLTDMGLMELQTRSKPARQLTRDLAPITTIVPFRDYHVGSAIKIPADDTTWENVQVQQITLTQDLDVLAGNLVLDTKIASQEAKALALTAALAGVTTLAGAGSTITPPKTTAAILESANGKNHVTYSQEAASDSVPGVVAGDLWFQFDPDAPTHVVGQWQWDGGHWALQQMSYQVIAAVDAGTITVGFLNADRIQANSLNATKLVAGSITADQIAAGAVRAEELSADAIDGKTITGVKISGTSYLMGPLISGTGDNVVIDGAVLTSRDTGNNIGTFNRGTISLQRGSSGMDVAGSNFNAGSPINFQMAGGADFNLSADSSGPRVWSAAIYNRPPYSGSANGFVTDQGTLGRTASSRRYKQNIKSARVADPYRILDVKPRIWRDKAQMKRTRHDARRGLLPEGWSVDTVPWHFGAIAEELHDLGLSHLVDYNPDGSPEAIRYDRVAVALIPALKDMARRLDALEQR